MAPTQLLKEEENKKSESNNYDETKQLLPPRSSNRYLGCFGYPCRSDDDSSADQKAAAESVRWKKVGGHQKKRRYHFNVSWSKFRLTTKKPAAPAPKEAELLVVPLDSNTSRSESRSIHSWKTRARKLINRLSFSKSSSVNDLVVVVAKDPSFYDCQVRPKEESIINHPREKENQSSSNVSRSQSDCRLSDKGVTVTYKMAGSPDHPSKITGTKKKRSAERHDDQMERDSDPLIGISIVMITLIIMLVWGRLCAILCTSAWFYCVPRFKGSSHKNHHHVDSWVNKKHLDTANSELYKKKLILEGLLQRNHVRTSTT